MENVKELFENGDLPPVEFLEGLRLVAIASSDKDALRAILKQQWDLLQEEPAGLDAKARKKWRASRGYALERIMFKLLALEELDPSPSYYAHRKKPPGHHPTLPKRRGRRPGGEQIDGSFELEGKYFLLEIKWQGEVTPSDMYAFRGRVEGKLVGTIGVMVSASGFAEDAEDALLWGKEVNVLLVTGEDITLSLEPGNSFRAMMRAKLREAADVGRVFYAYSEFLDERGA